MKTKPEINALGIGDLRIRRDGKNWITEQLIVLGNPISQLSKWKLISRSPTFRAAAKQLFGKLGQDGQYLKKDLISAIRNA